MTKPICPECGGTNLLMEIASFWARANSDGSMAGDWGDYESSTEPTGVLMCGDCTTEFEPEGDEDSEREF